MQGFSNLKIVFDNLIATKVVKKVYHSVILRKDANGYIKPSAPVAGAYEYVGIDDTKGFSAYCRALGPLEKIEEERISSCAPGLTKVQVLTRLVFFSDYEKRDFDDLNAVLLNAVLASGSNIKFQKLHNNVEDLLRQESPKGTFNFKTGTYYSAIDFYVLLKLTTTGCGLEIKCAGVENPYC